jgi:hypothetical protein
MLSATALTARPDRVDGEARPRAVRPDHVDSDADGVDGEA